MNSLRARIATVLIGAITCVVLIATYTVTFVLRDVAAHSIIDPSAEQLRMIIRLVEDKRSTGRDALLSSGPATGQPNPRLTGLMNAAFMKIGEGRQVLVTQPAGRDKPLASVELSPHRWLVVPVAGEPSPPRVILAAWMALIILGTAGISLVVARLITLPLTMLESVSAGIGPDGYLQPIPERGPAEIKATARALNVLSRNLRRAIESRMRLVAAAGHDLRTPMTRMRLRAEFLEETDREKWLQDLDELDRIADSAMSLVREEVENSGGELIRLDEMARAIAQELASQGLPVVVRQSVPALLLGAPLALTRALRNLFINAAVHGGGAQIDVEERGGRAVVVILDQGPGIPDDLIDRVFEPFFRVDPSRHQAVPGAGLGLVIAKEIVRRIGGELTLTNRREGGLRQEAIFPAPMPS